MSKIFYKVVRLGDDGCLYSCVIGNSVAKAFDLKEVLYQFEEFVESDTFLCAFYNLEDAISFYNTRYVNDNWVIYSCEIGKILPISPHIMGGKWPKGTVHTDKIKLLKEIIV